VLATDDYSADASLLVVVVPLDEPLDEPVVVVPPEDELVDVAPEDELDDVAVDVLPPVPLPLAKSDEFSRHCRLTMPPAGSPFDENWSDCGHEPEPVM
jgi:hypothetical protein